MLRVCVFICIIDGWGGVMMVYCVLLCLLERLLCVLVLLCWFLVVVFGCSWVWMVCGLVCLKW